MAKKGRAAKKKKLEKNNNGATVGYEAQLWKMADALRGGMDAAGQGVVFARGLEDG
jgi:hypothetical protein